MDDQPLQPAPEHPPSPLRRFFLGARGLRPGWSLLLYLILLSPVLTLLFSHPHNNAAPPVEPRPIPPFPVLFVDGIEFLYVLAASWILSRIERRSIGDYGLNAGPRRPQQFLTGLFWGAASLSLLVGTLWKLGLLVFDARLLSAPTALTSGLIWFFCFLCVALAEDYLMRGCLQFTFARALTGLFEAIARLFSLPRNAAITAALGFWTSALLLSFLFGLGHSSNPGESSIGLLSAGLAGLVFCLSLWRTGSLWWAIGFHCTWDWAQSFLYGVADSGGMIDDRLLATHPVGGPILSGGATGPEGSVLVLPVLALVAVIIVFTLPKESTPAEAEFPAA